MSVFRPVISASSVAGLIGMNPYKPPAEVMYGLMVKDVRFTERIQTIEFDNRLAPYDAVKRKVLANPIVKQLVDNSFTKVDNSLPMKEVMEDLNKTAKTFVDLKYSNLEPETRTKLSGEIVGQFAKTRGNVNENAILDSHEKDTGVKIVERNTKSFTRPYDKFMLTGRTDGYVTELNRIVDSKERTRYFTEPPLYDEIQMRSYMAIFDIPEAELIERFPDGTKRTTLYKADEAGKWDAIKSGLDSAVDKMNLALNDNNVLMNIIKEYSVRI
jgi:hypothetical protein